MEELIRLNKFLSDSGICSRREADRLIEAGKINVDGTAAVIGQKITLSQVITYKGKHIMNSSPLVLIAVNKPRGIVCTTAKEEKDNIVDFVSYNERIYPIGRLDKDSEGLILMTNKGEIVNKILRAGNTHDKEYVVKVNKNITKDFISEMSKGVPILDTITRPCIVEKISEKELKIILTQGLNRQIRRMCECLGYKVLSLKRIRIMNISLGNLKIGTYRKLSGGEISELIELTSTSSNLSYKDTEKVKNHAKNRKN
jgi:pseudouridine synthase